MAMHQPIETLNALTQLSTQSRWRRWLMYVILFLVLAWCLAVLLIWFKQEKLLFHPEPLTADHRFKLAYTSEVFIDVPGAKLHALYLQQPAEKSKGIVLFLHGNAGNLETWFTGAEFWLTTGFDVLMPDYRGFGKSTGQIESEAQLNDDVLHAWKFVAQHYVNKKKVVYGRSLGTGLATTFAKEEPVDLLVLVSPYTSMTAIARHYYPWVPSAFLRYPLKTDLLLPQLHSKIVLFHGDKDSLIPVAHSERLQKLNSNAQLIVIPGAGHGDIHNFTAFTDALKQALDVL